MIEITEHELINLCYQEEDVLKQKQISTLLDKEGIPHRWGHGTLVVRFCYIEKALLVLSVK